MILVDAIHRETVGSPLQSLVDQYLLGTMEHYILCESCKTCKYRTEAYMSLLLPVKGLQPHVSSTSIDGNSSGTGTMTTTNSATTIPDIGDALRGYLVDEELSGSNAYECEVCASKQTAHKGIRLSSKKLPSILCLQLNRFEFDFITLGRKKVYDPLLPLLTLDMDKYTYDSKENSTSTSSSTSSSTTNTTPETTDNEEKNTPTENIYDLHAILMHLGGALGGHYFAYIRSPDDPMVWLEFNDSVVTKIPEDQLLRALGQLGPDVVEKTAPKETIDRSNASSSASSGNAAAVPSSTDSASVSSTVTDGTSTGLSSTIPVTKPTVVKAHHSAAGGAYMLVYRRRESSPKTNNDTVPVDLIPSDLRKKIETDNQAYHAARAEWEENRRKISFRLYYAPNTLTQRALQLCGLLGPSDNDIKSLTNSSTVTVASFNPFAMPVTEDTNLPYVSVTVKDYESIETLFRTSLVALGTHLKGSAFNAANITLDKSCINEYLRFRHYDHVKKIAINPITYSTAPESTTVMGAGIYTGRSLLLDTRDSTETPWSTWIPGTLPLRIIVMTSSNGTLASSSSSLSSSSPLFESATGIFATGSFDLQLLPTEQTVEHLRNAVARRYNSISMSTSDVPVTTDQIRLIILRQSMETPALLLTKNDQSLVTTGNKDIDTSGPKLTAGDIIHIEICAKEPSETLTERVTNPLLSPVVTAWDRQLNLVKVTFNIPAIFTPVSPLPVDIEKEGDYKLVLTVDQRLPLVTFRSLIAQALSTAPSTFRIRRDMRGPEFKDGKQSLQYYALVDGTSVFLQPGRPLEVDEHEFIITVALPVNDMNAETMEKLNNSSNLLPNNNTLPSTIPRPPLMPTGPRPSGPVGLPGPMMNGGGPRPGLPTPPRPGLPPPPPLTTNSGVGGPRPPGAPTDTVSPTAPNSATTPIGMPQTKYVTLGVVVMKAGLPTKDAKHSILEQVKDKAKELGITLPLSTHIRIRERLTPNGVKLGKVYIDSYTLSANASSGPVPIKLGDNARELVLQFTVVPEIATEDSIPIIPVLWSPRNNAKPFEWGTEMLASTKETVSELTLRVSQIMGIDKDIGMTKASSTVTSPTVNTTPSPTPSSPTSSSSILPGGVTPSILLCKPHMFALTQATRDPKEIWGFKWPVRLPVRKDTVSNMLYPIVINVDTATIIPSLTATLNPSLSPVSDTGNSTSTNVSTPSSASSTTVSTTIPEVSPSSSTSSSTNTTTTATTTNILTTIVSQPPLALRPGDIVLIVNGEEYDDPDIPGRPPVNNDSSNTPRAPSSARYSTGEVAFKIYTQEEKLLRLNTKKMAEEERKKLMETSKNSNPSNTDEKTSSAELDKLGPSASASLSVSMNDIKSELGNFLANKRSRPSD